MRKKVKIDINKNLFIIKLIIIITSNTKTVILLKGLENNTHARLSQNQT